MTLQPYKILIIGGGIVGLASALSLTKFAPAGFRPTIEVYEIRPEPGTIGGAMRLTPNALRVLDHLDVYEIIKERDFGIPVDAMEVFSLHHHKCLAEVSFRGPKNQGMGAPPYKALHITRASLMESLVEAVSKLSNITFHCGKRARTIDENEAGISVMFEDGTIANGDLLLGCDGVHSFTRNKHVDPARKQVYSGISNAFGFVPLEKDQPVHFQETALNFGRRGMLLTSYHEKSKTSGYVGAITHVKDVGSRDGWKAKGSDVAAVKANMMARFGDSVLPAATSFIQGAEDWFLWPVYMVPHGGLWATQRAMLLGDAAHAMPPQGESTGIALEDAVLLARCLLQKQAMNGTIKEGFDAYEKIRRDRVNLAWKESQGVLDAVKDTGAFGHALKTWIIPIFLWLGQSARAKRFEADVTRTSLEFDDIEMAPQRSTSLSKMLMPDLMVLKPLTMLWYRLRTVWTVRKPDEFKD